MSRQRTDAFFLAIPEGSRAVVLEDDGVVGWAYLHDSGSVVSDVWLYNVGEDPDEVEVRGSSDLPPQNPRAFCSARRLPRLTREMAIRCSWFSGGVVRVFVDGRLWAELRVGCKPGWSVGAAQANQVARPLSEILD